MNEIKNIVCIGCSHTDGIYGGLKYKSTYPYYLSKLFPNATVYNLGIGSGNNLLAYSILKNSIDFLQPDLIVRQITTKFRFSMHNQNKSMLNFIDYTKKYEDRYYAFDKTELWNDSIFCSSSSKKGNLYNQYQISKIHKFYYKYFHNQTILDTNEACLIAGDEYLKNIKHFTFSWFNKNIHKDCPSIENVIGFQDRYVHDNALHFNADGNKKVAEFVNEQVRKKYKNV